MQPVTIVKTRKERKITVPAGGWFLMVTPDEHISEHIAERAKLIQSGRVNDDYEQLITGHVNPTHPQIRFATSTEAAQAADIEKKLQDSFKKSAEDAQDRQAKMGQEAKVKAEQSHSEQVKKINKFNDSIRTQAAPARPRIVTVMETKPETAKA